MPGIEMSSTATSGRRVAASSSASVPVDGLAHDHESGLALQHVADTGPDDRVIVGDEYPDRRAQSRAAGRPPGAAPRAAHPHRADPRIVRVPPRAPIRSRIPASPMWPPRSSSSGRAPVGPRPSSLTSSSTPSRLTEMPMSTERACGVAQHVRERLLERAEQGELRLLGKRWQGWRARPAPTRMPLRSPNSATSDRSAGRRPRSSSRDGRRSLVTLRMLRIPVSISPSTWSRRALCAGGEAVPQHAELHLDRGEHLAGLVVELAGEPPALLFVLLDHPRREARELEGARLQAAVEVRVLQRGAHLLAQRDQKPVVERGERVAGVAHEHERAHGRLVCGTAGVRRRTDRRPSRGPSTGR